MNWQEIALGDCFTIKQVSPSKVSISETAANTSF